MDTHEYDRIAQMVFAECSRFQMEDLSTLVTKIEKLRSPVK
jgi:dUTPase